VTIKSNIIKSNIL